MFSWLWTFYLYLSFLSLKRIEAEDEFCDSFSESMYCNCNFKYAHTTMTCTLNKDMKRDDKLWRNISTVDNVVILKVQSRLPARLSEIPIDSLKLLPYLESFSISLGNLSDIEPYAISGLKILRELDLEDCEITSLQKKAITNLPKLKKLSLSGNYLEEITEDSLSGLLNLESLILERNTISRIEPCAFCDLQNLKELSLFSNQITDLTEYIFRGLLFLNNLDLSKNKIRILNDRVFHSLERLDILDLSDNLIYHIGNRAFQGLKKLRSLILKSNKIKSLHDQIFSSLPNLRLVDLDKNELQTLQVQVLDNMDKIEDPHFYIALKNNPLICDCRLSWVDKYLELSKSHLFKNELKQLQCTTAGKNPKNETVHLLDLDCSDFFKQQNNIITTSKSVVAKSSDLIPYEIQKPKNKTMSSEPITSEEDIFSQDSEIVDSSNESVDLEPSAARTINADFKLTLCVVLLTLLLVRKRKGTWL